MTAPVGFFTTNELALMPCTPVLNTAVRLVLVGTAVAFGAGPREDTLGCLAPEESVVTVGEIDLDRSEQ